MNKSTGFLIGIIGLLGGIILGFMLAPIKNGIECGNNNGNTRNYYYGPLEAEERSDSDEDDF